MESTKALGVKAPSGKLSRERIPWWKTGVIYQIYVRSFLDTNGDGVGDLPGVIRKLDYLKSLGIDGIWLSPVTASANADWGYDVVDYYGIDPVLGTMADFEKLLAEARQRGIKVLMDFVPNHTSIKHPWFQNALTGRDAKYRDYYIWADPKTWGRKPNNWKSWFGGSAWSYHRATKQYYLHNFLPQQADLNWRNPQVRQEFDDIMRFWLDKGVDGFRIDVFNMLIKDQGLRNNPKSSRHDNIELRILGQEPLYNTSRPEIHSVLRHWRKITDSYPGKRLLLGETTMVYRVRQLAAFYGDQDELELAFNFNFLRASFSAKSLKKVVQDTETALKSPDWPVWTASNHDELGRFTSRWSDGDERKIRCGLLILLTLKGTPVMYYGDEIGLGDVYVPPWRLQDPWGVKYWPVFSGRDRARTPMQWDLRPGAGFTADDVRPWLPHGRLQERNVGEQLEKEDSTWHFTHDLLALRRKLPDLQLGGYQVLPAPADVWAWHRGQGLMVVINLSNQAKSMRDISGTILLCTDRKREGQAVTKKLELDPWQGVVIKLS